MSYKRCSDCNRKARTIMLTDYGVCFWCVTFQNEMDKVAEKQRITYENHVKADRKYYWGVD